MESTNKKKPQNHEKVDLNAVDQDKLPKRVRRKETKLVEPKPRPTKPKPVYVPDGEKRPSGTQKKLLLLPFEVNTKHPVRSGKLIQKIQSGFSEKDSAQKSNSRKRTSKQEISEMKYSGREGAILNEAFQTSSMDPHFTQGFHIYPGRIPIQMAKLLVENFGKGGLLFDPFMGSGTILLEGLLAGMQVAGNDLNPIARVITRERCRWLSLRNARRVWTEVEELRQSIEEEKLGKRRVEHAHAEWLQNRYPPHLLVEMLNWMERINDHPDPSVRESLRAVFSSLIYRFTPAPDAIHRKSRIGRGQFGRAMSERTKELIEAQTELASFIRLIENPLLFQGDTLVFERDPSLEADLILTRPPFPGSSKHMLTQNLLLKWLDLPVQSMETEQLGSGKDLLKKNWTPRFRKVMLNLRRATVSGGRCILFFEDWVEHGKRVDSLEFVSRFSGSEGWTVIGSASRQLKHSHQEKKDYGREGKYEHLIILRY